MKVGYTNEHMTRVSLKGREKEAGIQIYLPATKHHEKEVEMNNECLENRRAHGSY